MPRTSPASASRFGRLTVVGTIATLIAAAALLWMTDFRFYRNGPKAVGALKPSRNDLVWNAPSSDEPRPSNRADLQFQLVNVGETPVRVLGIESGCGCTKPVVSPTLVKGGGTAMVDVSAIPPAVGEKRVTLVVHTDSPLTPEIELFVRLVSTRKPPYVYLVDGNLTWRGRIEKGDSREMTVVSIVPSSDAAELELRADVEFLAIEPAGATDDPDEATGHLRRARTYRVKVKRAPPPGTRLGSVVVDPWSEGEPHVLPVLVEASSSGLRASPPSVALGTGERREARVIVFTDGPTSGLDASIEGPADVNISARVQPRQEAGRVHELFVTLKGDPALPTPEGDEIALVVRRPDTGDALRVPISWNPDEGEGR